MVRKVLLLILVVLTIAATAAAKAGPRKKPHKAKAPVVQPAPEPTPTPPQLTPEQGPSSPPEVSFQGGQLTIVARNSTMGDVLTAVKQRTGAAVDMPAVSSERVVGRFGPGTPRDVMAQLLNGSHYDYVLVGSPTDPGSLKKVVLVARINGPEPAAQRQQGSAVAQRNPNQNLEAVPEIAADDQQQEDNSAEAPEAQEQAEQEEPQPEQPQQQPAPNGPMVKTPEQLLRELQQQQQQQQQQPQQQNGEQGAPPQ
jgi:hypothetical protein